MSTWKSNAPLSMHHGQDFSTSYNETHCLLPQHYHELRGSGGQYNGGHDAGRWPETHHGPFKKKAYRISPSFPAKAAGSAIIATDPVGTGGLLAPTRDILGRADRLPNGPPAVHGRPRAVGGNPAKHGHLCQMPTDATVQPNPGKGYGTSGRRTPRGRHNTGKWVGHMLPLPREKMVLREAIQLSGASDA